MNDSERRELRALASSQRFIKAWALLASPEDAHVLGGMRGIKRLLAAQGRSISDLLLILEKVDDTPDPASHIPTSFDPHEIMRKRQAANAEWRSRAAARASQQPDSIEQHAAALYLRSDFDSEGLPVIGGHSMPPTVEGTPAIIAREDTPFGLVLLFCIISKGSCYGPIASIDPKMNSAIDIHARILTTLRVHVIGPYPHCPVPIANRAYSVRQHQYG